MVRAARAQFLKQGFGAGMDQIAAEARRFPELGRPWREQGPDRFAEPLAAALGARDDLRVPNMELAIVQFYALVLYP
ncbi:MAG: hypothetical protein HOV97_38735, partial [Nonomuraea sp.]|nr:hypothetical protein [Nonomuraea sp.]